MRILSADGVPVKNSNQLLYTAPTEKYFPRDNDFTDFVAPTLTGAEAKLYDEIVRLCDRTTGYCAYNERALACKTKLGYSTVRASVPVLEACGLVARRRQRKYFGVDTMGREQWHDEGNHFQVLAKECWRIFPKAPRKPRNGPPAEVKPEDLAPRTLAEIKQQAAKIKLESAYFQHSLAENKRTKQDLSFKTSFQDKQQARARENVSPVPTPSNSTGLDVVVEEVFSEAHKERCEQSTSTCNPELLAQVLAVGVEAKAARQLVEKHAATLPLQLACLNDRNPKDRAAVLVKATRADWQPPAAYQTRLEAQIRAENERHARKAADAKATQQQAATAQRNAAAEDETATLDAEWEVMSADERAPVEAKLAAHFAKMPAFMRCISALDAARRKLQRGESLDAPAPVVSQVAGWKRAI